MTERCGRCGAAAGEGALIFTRVRGRARHPRSASTAGPGRVRVHAELALCDACGHVLERLLAGAIGRRNLAESPILPPPRTPT